MASYFCHTRTIDYDNQICHAHRAETMRNQQCNTAIVITWLGVPGFVTLSHCRVAFKKRVLGLGIESGCGFIENDQQRTIPHETSSQGKFLPLAKTNVNTIRPGSTKLSVQPCIQALNNIVCSGASNRGPHGRLMFQSRNISQPHCMTRSKFKAKKVLKCACKL